MAASGQQYVQPHSTGRPSHSALVALTSEHVPSYADDDAIAPAATVAGAHLQPEPEVSNGALLISARVEHAAIPSGRAQDVFGIVTLRAAAQGDRSTTEQRQPLDLVCVLDVSGSMQGEKLRLVQEAVRFVVGESLPHDRLSIVAFNSNAHRAIRLCRMHNNGKSEATAATLRLTAGGGTNIARGLEAAVEVMEQRKQRNTVSAILLLTDGHDGFSRASLPSLVARVQGAGCSLYTFGFGRDHDARLLADVAEHAHTPFTFVEEVDQIGAAFAGAVGGLASVEAQRVDVILTFSVTLKAVHTAYPVTHEGSRGAFVRIPDMIAGERRDILVELSVPVEAESKETLLMTASARYWDLAAGAVLQTPNAELRLARTADDEPQPELEPDEEVTTQRHRVEVAQTLKKATGLGERGLFQDAQAVLSAHEGRLRSATSQTPTSQALAAELQDAQTRMQSRATWECGGRAELQDAMQMHAMQRTTNISASIQTPSRAMTRRMYSTPTQMGWISRSLSSP